MGFVRAEREGLIQGPTRSEPNLRRLYSDTLAFVRDLDRRHGCVCLAGAYTAQTGTCDCEEIMVGVIALKSKAQDPAAPSRRTLFAPARIDLADAWARALEDDPEI